MALVALSRRQEGTAIVAEARYALAQEDDIAEFAIAVADDFQARGLGRHLVKRLLVTAWRRGVRRLFAEIKSDNRAMLAFAIQLGFRLRGSLEDHSVVIASMVSSTDRSDRRGRRDSGDGSACDAESSNAMGTVGHHQGPFPKRELQRLRRKEREMIGAFVTFRYRDNFDERAVRTIAESRTRQVRRHAGATLEGFHGQFREE